MSQKPPRWDLTNVYPSLDSKEFEDAMQSFTGQITSLEQVFANRVVSAGPASSMQDTANLVGEVIDSLNSVYTLAGTLNPYISSFITTNSRDNLARKKMSEYEQVSVRLRKLTVQFQAWIGTLSPDLEKMIELNPVTRAHAFGLIEEARQSKYLMTDAEESLAADLNLSGAGAWGRLQGTITSQLSGEIEVDGEIMRLPLPAVINLHSHPDRGVRKQAYDLELSLLDTSKEALAASMNGVKGTVVTLNQRRGREDALHSAIDQARITRRTLETMLSAMQASFPSFRKYFVNKAHRLGEQKMTWFDLWAPVGKSSKTYSFTEARDLILEHFSMFSGDLVSMAQRAFENNWIDAEQRDGKRGGAFCMGLAGVAESRILCNFDGTLDQVSTIAHELGHAFHNDCAYRAGKTPLQKSTPMTLAETASIMCETIINQAVLAQVTNPEEELAILDTILIGDSQVIVDIYSRYLFEKEVFERREKSELSADDFCEIMLRSQSATYGDALDENFLNKYMWAWKPHYYREGLSFYNFPYTFGLLFGIGLYAVYKERGAGFVADYQDLLASTGEASAVDLASRFGIDLESPQFWSNSIEVIAQRVDRYCAI